MIKLYSYFRSSASYRVRIALNYKELEYSQESIHLVRGGGEQFSKAYLNVNPQAKVPSLIIDDEVYTQSLAIMELLEELYPEPAILPKEPKLRARVRSVAQMIACDIHPLNNLSVLKYIVNEFNMSEEAKLDWYCHWISNTFQALEKILSKDSTDKKFCYGDSPTIADMCLIPQVYNANRFKCDMTPYPTLQRINDHCVQLESFIKAHPDNQIDAG